MPEQEQSPIALDDAKTESDADISVVMLPKEPPAEDPAVTEAEPAPAAATPQPAPTPEQVPPPPLESLLQTDVIAPDPEPDPEPIAPEPEITETTPPVEEPPFEPQEEITTQDVEPIEPPADGPLMAYNDTFPHFEGAVGGCFGFNQCRRVSGAGTYRSVARSLISDLEAQGYGVDLRDDLEDTGRNVYELTPPDGDTIKYLLVFSDTDGSAVYVMSDRIMTLNDLQALQAQTRANRQSS